MRRLLALCLFVPVLAAAGSSRAEPVNWKTLRYFDYPSQRIYIGTDGSWSGARIVRVPPVARPRPPDRPWAQRGLTSNYIWAPSCVSGRQFVSFSRTFMAPGLPEAGTFFFAVGVGVQRPYRSATLEINGRSVATLRRKPFASWGELPASARSAVRFGANTITIRVEKSALKSGERCNTRSRSVGVNADLYLRFRGGMKLVPLQMGPRAYVRMSSSTAEWSAAIPVVNEGPSASLGGRFQFQYSAGVWLEAVLDSARTVAASPFGGCTVDYLAAAPLKSGTLTCPYDPFTVGRRATIVARGVLRLQPGFPPTRTTRLLFSWGISQDGPSSRHVPTYLEHEIVLCGAQSTEPGCENAR